MTGLALSMGLLLLVYWLASLAAGAHAYEQARAVSVPRCMQTHLRGLLAAFVYHLLAGMRHLVWDTGRGLERASARRSAWALAVASVLVTLLLIYGLLWPGSGAR